MVPDGRCPIGRSNGARMDGLGSSAFTPAGGWAEVAAPEHGSAIAGGATLTETVIARVSPAMAASAGVADVIRQPVDMSHLSWRDVRIDVGNLIDVTIGIPVTSGASEVLIDTHP